MEGKKSLIALIHREEKLYVAQCPEARTVSQGETIESALANLKEATQLYLDEFSLDILPPLFVTSFLVDVEEKSS